MHKTEVLEVGLKYSGVPLYSGLPCKGNFIQRCLCWYQSQVWEVSLVSTGCFVCPSSAISEMWVQSLCGGLSDLLQEEGAEGGLPYQN